MGNINESLATLLQADGALCAAIVDANSGMTLGKSGTGLDLDLAAAGNTEVVRAKMKTMKSLGLADHIEVKGASLQNGLLTIELANVLGMLVGFMRSSRALLAGWKGSVQSPRAVDGNSDGGDASMGAGISPETTPG